MKSIKDKKVLTKYVASFVLGDGYLSSLKSHNKLEDESRQHNKIKNSCYQIKQIESHKDYIEYQAEILENVCGVYVGYSNPYTDKRGYNCSGQYHLKTKAHPFFTEFRNRLYATGKRQLDPHYFSLFDWETLACLYMDNGWIENKQTENNGIWTRISIATHAYTSIENKVLRDFIAHKFGIHFDVNHQKSKIGNIHYYLRCTKDNSKRFIEGIEPYILKSFKYKIDFTRLTPVKG